MGTFQDLDDLQSQVIIADGRVEFRADLPIVVGTPVVGSVYLVEQPTTILLGIWTTFQSGLYIRDNNNGNLDDWTRLNIKVKFTDGEFRVVNASDQSKQGAFDMTGLTTATTRTLTWQDKDGVIATVSDIKSIYTGSEVMTQNAFVDGPGSAFDIVFANIGDFSIFTSGTNDILLSAARNVVIAQNNLRFNEGSFTSDLLSATLTASRTVTIPNKTGIIALLSDLATLVDSVNSGTNITVDNTDPQNPIINLDTAITGTSVNGVTLNNAGVATNFLNETGIYSAPDTIYTANGSWNGTRSVSANNTGILSFNAFDTDQGSFTEVGVLSLSEAGAIISYIRNIGGSRRIRILESAFQIEDSYKSEGISYALDYKTNGIATYGSRWIPDRGYTTLAHVGNYLEVDSLDDLPSPVGNVIDVSALVTIQINLEQLDLGANMIKTTGNLEIRGLGGSTTNLTSSHDDGTIEYTQEGALNNINVSNTGANGIAVKINGATAVFFMRSAQIFGNIEVGLCALIDAQGLITGQVRYTVDNPFARYTYRNTAFAPQSTLNVHKFDDGVTCAVFEIDDCPYFPFDAASRLIEVENPSAIGRGSLDKAALFGAARYTQCEPVSTGNFSTIATNARGMCVDGDGNLITVDITTDLITRYVGISSTVDISIAAPAGVVQGVTWHKGDLYAADSGGTVYRQDGFSTTNISTVVTGQAPIGIVFIGDDMAIIDSVDDTVYIFDGFSNTLKQTIDLTGIITGTPGGIGYDGINLITISGGVASSAVTVWDGLSNTVQYIFDTQSDNPQDLEVLPSGEYLELDLTTVYEFGHSVTFDHSSPTWTFSNNTGPVKESSDRGGSSFSDPSGVVIAITTQNEWLEISGTDMFYSPLSEREKNFLSNELNGEITWKGVRNRGRIFHGEGMITRTGGGATNIFYELAIGIDMGSGYIIQKDSIGTSVLANNNAFAPIATSAVTRDMDTGYKSKLFIRNITNTQDPVVSIARLAIN